MKCWNCGEEMIMHWGIYRADGGFGKPIREEHYQCPGCHILAVRGVPVNSIPGDGVQIKASKEKLAALGYLEAEP